MILLLVIFGLLSMEAKSIPENSQVIRENEIHVTNDDRLVRIKRTFSGSPFNPDKNPKEVHISGKVVPTQTYVNIYYYDW